MGTQVVNSCLMTKICRMLFLYVTIFLLVQFSHQAEEVDPDVGPDEVLMGDMILTKEQAAMFEPEHRHKRAEEVDPDVGPDEVLMGDMILTKEQAAMFEPDRH